MSDQRDLVGSVRAVSVDITRLIDDCWPGYVECRLIDATGREWLFHDKVPVVTLAEIDAKSSFPQLGAIACRVVDKNQRADGRDIVTIDTESPWGVEATTGATRFEVYAEQVIMSWTMLHVTCQAITVEVQDERGQSRPGSVVWRRPMLPGVEAADFPCLRFVDPYGDTVFNQLQIPFFLDDLRRILESPLPDEQFADIQSIEALVKPYIGSPHFYVKLIGD